MSLFSLLSFSQRIEGSLACKFSGVDDVMEYGHQRVTFEVTFSRKEYSNEKQSGETLSKFLLNAKLFSLGDFGFCMENLHAKEPCHDRLRPYFVSSPLNSLRGCTENGKVPCRQRHPQ